MDGVEGSVVLDVSSVEPSGKGSDVYGGLMRDRYISTYVERRTCMDANPPIQNMSTEY